MLTKTRRDSGSRRGGKRRAAVPAPHVHVCGRRGAGQCDLKTSSGQDRNMTADWSIHALRSPVILTRCMRFARRNKTQWILRRTSIFRSVMLQCKFDAVDYLMAYSQPDTYAIMSSSNDLPVGTTTMDWNAARF